MRSEKILRSPKAANSPAAEGRDFSAPTIALQPLPATCSCRTSRRCSSGSLARKKPRAYARSFFLNVILAATYSPTNTLRSTIGEGGLNCRVRHGTGCVPSSMTTKNLYVLGCDLCVFPCVYFRSPALNVFSYAFA